MVSFPVIVADSDIPFFKGVLEPYCRVSYHKGSNINRDTIKGADALVIRTRTHCNSSLLEGSDVKAIFSATIGLDHIDQEWCKEAGIAVYNVPGANALGVVQYILSALFILLAQTNRAIEDVVVGVVGAGNVGESLALFLESLGVEVLRCDPPRSEVEKGVDFYPLEELLSRANVISLNIPLNETTQNLVSKSFLEQCQEGAILINTSRGEVIDEEALIKYRGRFSGVALDVWKGEPKIDKTLVSICDIATPHIAGYSLQGKVNATERTITNVAHFFNIKQLSSFNIEQKRDDDRGAHKEQMTIGELQSLFTPANKQGRVATIMNQYFTLWSISEEFKKGLNLFEDIRDNFFYRDEFPPYFPTVINSALTTKIEDIELFYTLFSREVIEQLHSKNITLEVVVEQLNHFKQGFPYPKVVAPSTLLNSIELLTSAQQSSYIIGCKEYRGAVAKFIPASGAATRMFKELIEAYNMSLKGIITEEAQTFIDNLERFPLYHTLPPTLQKSGGKANILYIKELLAFILFDGGANWAALPKGIIPFHSYNKVSHTPIDEHLYEGAQLSKSIGKRVELTFSLAPSFYNYVKEFVENIKGSIEEEVGGELFVNYTVQNESSDTIAVNLDNTPVVNSDGTIQFRPGGHGALLENLNRVECDIVLIGNIDNVGRVEQMPNRIYWREVLIGALLSIEKRLFALRRRVEREEWSGALERELLHFIQRNFSITLPNNISSKKEVILKYMDRPIRVCGVVKNDGEPGGGPFLVEDDNGVIAPQILESVQLNLEDKKCREQLSSSTHFNPVEMVCSLKDYKGDRFNLNHFSDPQSGIIAIKSEGSQTIKALELPGLWNGSMGRWNTHLIEIPLSIFTPVKSLFDLLRPEHQPK